MNYHIEFARVVKEATGPPPNFHDGAGPLSPGPCILHLASKPLKGRYLPPTTNNKLSARFDVSSTCQLDSVSKILAKTGSSRKLDPKLEWNGGLLTALTQLQNNFGGRYNFQNSLSAASLTAR